MVIQVMLSLALLFTPTVESDSSYILEQETILMRVSAYAPHDNVSGICNDGNPSVTSTGSYPDKGTVAVDPNKIPYGTQLYIPGYGSGTALDTGGAMRQYDGYAIDLYFDTYEEAVEWGVRYIEVTVYKEVGNE